MPVTVAAEFLSSCTGCEISMLNMGGLFLELLKEIRIVHMPLLMDHKYFGQAGEMNFIEIPEAEIGIISGGIRNEEQLEVALKMRAQCRILVALGTCATHGGIPALMNQYSDEDLFQRYYRTSETTEASAPPNEVVPRFLDRTYALDEKTRVDVYMAGCPPHPDYIGAMFRALLDGESPEVPTKSVCDTCPTRREGKGAVQRIRRFTRSARFQNEKPLSEMKCLLEQGLLCMGPVTRAGCSGLHGDAPRCINARVPCRGCFGPVKQDGNQLLDMLNALASNGIDVRTIPDRHSLLRFSGAHGRLIRASARNLSSRGKEFSAPADH
jgi:F420-non-reducing hydrogenase small subunit